MAAIRCVKLNPLPGAKTIATFANGDAAIIENKHGKGKVITMAANPCVSKLAGNSEWKNFFLKFCQENGTKTQCDFWRFQLPNTLLPKQETIPGKCLTNNFVRWEHFDVKTPNNGNVTGTYALSPEPNHAKDAQAGEIPFSKGKLTDRPRAAMGMSACKGKSSWKDWSIAWKDVAEPIAIACKWSAPKKITAVKLFVSGVWRNAGLEIGGSRYEFPCPADFNNDTLSVRLVEMKLPKPVEASELKITMEANAAQLLLSEMEIWAE